ncbi:MAG TPA: Rieske (2Fe-2S) protein [Microlunatus sp.]|jgi:Rieske Fe-S protein|nr:Rieske (2Fe-2S) protein [Microlunatus sp.]
MSTSTPTHSAEATPPQTDPVQTSPTLAERPCCGRRTVLRAAGLVALSGGAVALAACSADTPATSPSAAPSSPEPSAAESSASASPSESASESPSEEASSEAAAPEGTEVAISEVAVGGGVVVDDKYVVTQPTEGEFKAFSAICTHQGCPVGSVEDGQIICPCHMSHFDITSGDPVSGPAQEPLPAVKLTKSGDNVYVTD